MLKGENEIVIRNPAKAIIFKNSKILLTKNEDEEGHFCLFFWWRSKSWGNFSGIRNRI